MKKNATLAITGIPTITTIFVGVILASSIVSADDSVVDNINITVPVSCTMSGTGMNSHNANITNGTYQANIGTTTLHAFCNDSEGFAIYAAGYTGDEIGATNSNKLVGTTASGNTVIDTGLATAPGNPDVSNWAMKLAITQDSGDTTGTNAYTIDSAPNVDLPSEAEPGATQASFSQYHVVPNEYVKVAHKNSATDMTANTGGVKLTTTYAAYISKTQPADTYAGQVIYTMVHPSNHAKPIANPATLDTGKTVNSKLRSLATTVATGYEALIEPEFDPDEDWGDPDEYIKNIEVHLKTPAPVGFIPTEANTISSTASIKPVYIVFDNTDDAGIMHFYTEGEQIVLSPDSSFMFYMLYELNEISSISDWDTSNVADMGYMLYRVGFSNSVSTFSFDLSSWNTSSATNMSGLFGGTGHNATTWSVGNLSSWDTSNVTDMSGMFDEAGYTATTWSVGNLSSWDTSKVTSMSSMFSYAGYSANSFSLSVSSWNTSSVTNMYRMFSHAGYSANNFSLNLSSWDTSNVTRMDYMFNDTGFRSTTFSLNLSSWDTSSVTDMTAMFSHAGYSATTWSTTIPATNGNSINNTTSRFYGQTTSIGTAPPTGRSFTLAQP